MHANPYQSAKFREKKKKYKRLKQIAVLISFLIVITGLIYFLNSDFLKIKTVSVNDLKFSDKTQIENIISGQINGKYFGLISKSNIFLFPRNNIIRTIKNTYSSVSAIDVDLKGLHSIEFQIEEFEPSARWCDLNVESAENPKHVNDSKISAIPFVFENTQNANCYLMTSEGMVFTDTEINNPHDFVTTFGFISGDPLRQIYGNSKFFRDLIDFVKLLRRLNIVVDEVWTTNGEVYAIVTNDNVKIYIDSEDDIVSVFNNLQTVIERDAINEAQFSNVDYFDLRFGNRVYYKLK